jgi:antitoxin ParD1/3/4
MNVSLTPELDEYVAEKVRSGLYSSASEVIREGLRLLREQEELRRIRLQELKRDISIGLEQLENGQGKTYASAAALIKDVKAEGRKRRAAAAGGKKRK